MIQHSPSFLLTLCKIGAAESSARVKHNQEFTLTLQAELSTMIKDATISSKDKQDAYKYLTSAKFKKRALFDLDSNFTHNKIIKITIKDIKVTKSLHVTIHGTIKVLKEESPAESLVKSILEDVIPKYAGESEQMPSNSAPFMIWFRHAKVVFRSK